MKAVVAAFNQEKALVGAFSVITNLRMELFEALCHDVTRDGEDAAVLQCWHTAPSAVRRRGDQCMTEAGGDRELVWSSLSPSRPRPRYAGGMR